MLQLASLSFMCCPSLAGRMLVYSTRDIKYGEILAGRPQSSTMHILEKLLFAIILQYMENYSYIR
jgi:hypothetical protein